MSADSGRLEDQALSLALMATRSRITTLSAVGEVIYRTASINSMFFLSEAEGQVLHPNKSAR